MKIELINEGEIFKIIPLLNILSPSLPDEVLRERLSEMVTQGYKCVGIYDGDQLIGICGIWILTKYYVGKHIEPDNMVFLPEYRSKGLGKELMSWVYEYGLKQGCVASELNCYLTNKSGQKFWKQEGYEPIAYHYQKKLL